jgi:cytochrome c553
MMARDTGDARARRTLAFLLLIAARGTSLSAQAPRSERSPSFAVPGWAFPRPAARSTPTAVPGATDDSVTPRTVPHGSASFTQAQIHNHFDIVDWQPASHAPMPAVVERGRAPSLWACGYCHLPNGLGRPENAMLAGLPAAYIVQQVADIKARARRSALEGFRPGLDMERVADSATLAEARRAAQYFARATPRRRSTVVEAVSIPRSIAGNGLYFPDSAGGREPLGRRLIEMATDAERHELRDPMTPYVAYVPPGSVRRGRTLATVGRGATKPCTSCHGQDLRGVGAAPPIAGRAASYLLRQLIAFRTGARAAPAAASMREEAATLDLDDMIAAAAYVASQRP